MDVKVKNRRVKSVSRNLPLEHRRGAPGSQSRAHGNVLLAFGANSDGPWGAPAETFARALAELERHGVRLTSVSPLYETVAVGQTRQAPYLNGVALVTTSLPAPALLRLMKQIEARAGRRGGRPWGSRTLDLDIIDYKGLISNWRLRRREWRQTGARPLMLPHPMAHERPFVLKPLLDVAPNWRHPTLQRSARELWRGVASRREGRVLRRLP